MQHYHRNLVAGGTYFFTVNAIDRSSRVLVDEIAALRGAVSYVRGRLPFQIDAWVVLPDHLHCVLTLPLGDADYPTRWRLIKSQFSRAVGGQAAASASRASKQERGIWQRRYWEHTVRDQRDYAVHIDYVHFNPVKHGLVERPDDWPYSTYKRAVARGFCADGLGDAPDLSAAGER